MRPDDNAAPLVRAAQQGDAAARERLVGESLPLLYNVVGWALDGHADVDDVVQDSVVRALRGLGGLRDPARFRPWLVSIAMNQVRRRWAAARRGALVGLDAAERLPDPAADFAGLVVARLDLSGQRREVAEATRWLDDDDRDLLALWWQEASGQLTRAELAAALDVSPAHAAVRVQRLKTRLDACRAVTRALTARRCLLLADLTSAWDGRPTPVWRKRIARHVRGCRLCGPLAEDLAPPEALLTGLALVPVPFLPHLLRAALTALNTSGPPPPPPPGGTPGGPTAADAPNTSGVPDPHGGPGAGSGPDAGGAPNTGSGPEAGSGPSAGSGPEAGSGPSAGSGPDTSGAMGANGGPGTGGAPGANGGPGTNGASNAGGGSGAHGGPGGGGRLDTSGAPDASGGPGASGEPGAGSGPGAGGGAGAGGGPGARGGSGGGAHVRAGRRVTPGRVVAGAAGAAAVGAALWVLVPGGPGREPAPAPVVVPAVSAPGPTRASRVPERPRTERLRRSASPRPSAAASTEQQVLRAVNARRAAAGCRPVAADARLHRAAQGHSDDMAARRVLDHDDANGDGPGDRLTAAGFRWSAWAENVAAGQRTPSSVVTSWMNSPPHRANILGCRSTRAGVGLSRRAGGPWWTLVLATPR
ncbi:sigma-70 family RNA polymerase sigma factor [Actinomadura atramentaria]|uniref:sigma-70 family RNA polymerase sigma factor n=1 Tax=Actinomadura atramentaria TaxID=1990 RepID=UPI000381BB1D|nr:sigma-70 family RNA polymerase sigma factor [Actinomadura atramentaria]